MYATGLCSGVTFKDGYIYELLVNVSFNLHTIS